MVTCFTVKYIHSPRLVPYYFQVIRQALEQRPHIPPIHPGSHMLVKTLCAIAHSLDVDVTEVDDVPGPRPWLQSDPEVSYTPTSKSGSSHITETTGAGGHSCLCLHQSKSHHLYTDRSVQADGSAGSAVFYPDNDPPPGAR